MTRLASSLWITCLLALAFLATSLGAVAAQEPAPLVQARLVSEVTSIAPGEPFTLALEQVIEPGWHTYWKNPGDSGLTTTVKWDLPEGITISQGLQFPAPHRMPLGTLMNFGYEDTAWFLTTMTPDPALAIGESITIEGRADWLVCKEICIPESQNVSITLPIAAQAEIDAAQQENFVNWRAQMPQKIDLSEVGALRIARSETHLTLTLEDHPSIPRKDILDVFFFPRDGVAFAHAGQQDWTLNDDRDLILSVPIANADHLDGLSSLNGVLMLQGHFDRSAYYISVPLQPRAAPVETAEPPQAEEPVAIPNQIAEPISNDGATLDEETKLTLGLALLFAFVGGIILNLMPCVFPILSMKALSLVNKAGKAKKSGDFGHAKIGGLVYTGGVLTAFSLLAAILSVLKLTGQQIGWGIQFQSPVFVVILAYLMVAIALMLAGVFSFGDRLANVGQDLTAKDGHKGSFFTGLLAVVVATPCTAPFMAGAIGFALAQPPVVIWLVLMALGLGMALPYLLITLNPTVMKRLPKPGAWMETFKHAMAFPMLGAAAWLFWVLMQQVGATGTAIALFGGLFLALALWAYGLPRHKKSVTARIVRRITIILSFAIVLLAIISYEFLGLSRVVDTCLGHDETSVTGVRQLSYSPEILEAELGADRPVLVNMTAAWCITCLANERIALGTNRVQSFLAEKNISYIKGDWTNRNDTIGDYLKSFDRSGVPLYVFYPQGYKAGTAQPIILPQLLTVDTVIDTLEPLVN